MSQIAILFLIVGVISYSVICRMRHMDEFTPPSIKWQHGLLNLFALFSIVVPPDWTGVCLGAGMVAFLLIGAPRWRHGVPGGTVRG